MRRFDWSGVVVVGLALAMLIAYRHWFIEPREWGATCAAADAPLVCAPRAGLLWLQQYGLWGGSALMLGVWAFLGGPFAVAVAAVAVGAVAVVNFNASFGVVGAALGAWAWIRREHAAGRGASPATAAAPPG